MARAQSSLSEQIAAARERGKKTMEKTPIAETAWYDADHDVVSVILESGQVASVLRKKLQDIAAVPANKLKSIEILGPGTAIFFDEAGVTLGVADMVKGITDEILLALIETLVLKDVLTVAEADAILTRAQLRKISQ